MPFPKIYKPNSAADTRPENRPIYEAICNLDIDGVYAALRDILLNDVDDYLWKALPSPIAQSKKEWPRNELVRKVLAREGDSEQTIRVMEWKCAHPLRMGFHGTTIFNWTPLHVACLTYGNAKGPGFGKAERETEIIQILLATGADPTAWDSMGAMPIVFCNGHAPLFLMKAMADCADKGTWPEPNPVGIPYDEGDVRPARTGIQRNLSFVPVGIYKDKRKSPKHRKRAEAA